MGISSLAIAAVVGVSGGGGTGGGGAGGGGGGNGAITVNILTPLTQGSVIAPAFAFLEAQVVSGAAVSDVAGDNFNPAYRDIFYAWTVRGTPLAAYSKIQNKHPGANPNFMYGKRVTFRFPDAGTYFVDLWCIDENGNTGTATTTITVAAPSYSSGNTIVLALDGNFSGAPAGTQVSTMDQLNSALAGRTNPTRISVKPGTVIPASRIILNTTRHLQYLDTWVAGQKATWQNRFINPYDQSGLQYDYDDPSPGSQFTMRDMIIDGGWDPTTETGPIGRQFFAFARVTTQLGIMIFDCEFRGQSFVDIGLRDNPATNSYLVISDCIVEDWQGYGIAAFPLNDTRARYSIQGNRVRQSPFALGGGPKTGMQNDHGCLRITNAERLHIACNDLFTTSGWSGWPPAANACVRMHTSAELDSSTIFERNVLEGGYMMIKIDGQNDGQTEYGGNHLIERNILIGTARLYVFLGADYGGTTFRNNLCYQPNVPIFDGGIYEFYKINPTSPNANNQRPFAIYNNTFVSRETAGNRPLTISPTSYWSTLINENNVFYNPGTTGQGPLDFATAIPNITPRYTQVRFNFEIYTSTFGANVPNGGTLSIPYANFDQSTGFTHGVLNTGSTAPTDQAYWQANAAAGDNLHMMRINTADFGTAVLRAQDGMFTVSYANSTNVVITNTSGTTWNAGTIELRLDRKSRLASQLPPALGTYANPAFIPTCAPLPGSNANAGAATGKKAFDSLYSAGIARTAPADDGAVESV